MATPPDYLRAAASGDTATLQQHFSPSALSFTDADGKNPVHLAAYEGHAPALDYLLSVGFPVDARTKKGLTAFHYAVFRGHLPLARTLHARAADVRAVDSAERSALHLACTAGSLPALTFLREELGLCPLDAPPSSDGMTCAHFAALAGHTEVLEWLGSLDPTLALLRAPNPTDVQPLHLAVMKSHSGATAWLVEAAGADVNAEEGKGRTPLHLAVAASSPPLVTYLLHAGADPRRVDKAGDTPERLARSMVASRSGGAPAERVRDLLVAAVSPPTAAPGAPSLLSADDAAELGAEATLPAPAYGRERDCVFLRWAQAEGGAGCPSLDYGLQWAPRGGLLSLSQAWRDAALAVLQEGAGESSEGAAGTVTSVTATPHPFACVQGLPPASPVNFRVRVRNANGWGPWSARSEEIVTAEAGAAVGGGAQGEAGGAGGAGAANESAAAGKAAPTASTASPSSTDAAEGAAAAAAASAAATSQAPTEAPLDVAVIEAVCSGNMDALATLTTPPLSLSLTATDTANARGVLHHAANSGQVGSLLWLLTALTSSGDAPTTPVSLDTRDALGATPLLLAVVGGHLAVVKALCARGASLNTPDSKGYSPLHYAALKSRPYIFRWLLEAGADPAARTLDGKTVRLTVEGMAAPPPSSSTAAAPSAAPSSTTLADELRSYLGNAECLPLAPPPPTYLMSTNTTISLALPLPKWAPGSPLPYGYEVQIALRSGFTAALSIAWNTVVEVAPTGVNICAPPYCAGGAGGGAAAAAERAVAAAAAAGAAEGSGSAAGSGGGGSSASASSSSSGSSSGVMSDPAIPSSLPFTPAVVVVTNLTPNTNYAFQIRALSAKGVGLWSARTQDLLTLPAERPLAPEIAASAAATATASGAIVAALKGVQQQHGSTAHLSASLAALKHMRPPLQAVLAALRGEKFVPAPLPAVNFGSPVKPAAGAASTAAAAAAASAPAPTPAAETTLLGAACSGNVPAFQALAKGVPWKEILSQGALHGAMLSGSEAILSCVLACCEAGASATPPATPAELCAAIGAFAPPLAEQAGWSPLHFASSAPLVSALGGSACLGGASTLQGWMQGDAAGVTPAHLAAHADNPALLHELRALAPRCLWEKDRGGLAPVHYAAAGNAPASLSYLLWAARAEGVGGARVQDALRRNPREVAREAGAAQAEKVLDAWEALRS